MSKTACVSLYCKLYCAYTYVIIQCNHRNRLIQSLHKETTDSILLMIERYRQEILQPVITELYHNKLQERYSQREGCTPQLILETIQLLMILWFNTLQLFTALLEKFHIKLRFSNESKFTNFSQFLVMIFVFQIC